MCKTINYIIVSRVQFKNFILYFFKYSVNIEREKLVINSTLIPKHISSYLLLKLAYNINYIKIE